MKPQRFQNDDEYFAYVRKTAKSERLLFYIYVAMGSLFLGLITDLVLVHFKIHLLGGILPFLLMVGISIPGIHKLKKSGWLEKNEDKAVNNAKVRLEKRRKKVAELGNEQFIKKSEKNLRDVMRFSVYMVCVSMSFIFSGHGPDWVYLIGILAISCSIGTLFILSKYFQTLIDRMMTKTKQDINEGYLYYYPT